MMRSFVHLLAAAAAAFAASCAWAQAQVKILDAQSLQETAQCRFHGLFPASLDFKLLGQPPG